MTSPFDISIFLEQQYFRETIFSTPAACFKVVLTETKSAPQENCTETPPTMSTEGQIKDAHSQLAGTEQDVFTLFTH